MYTWALRQNLTLWCASVYSMPALYNFNLHHKYMYIHVCVHVCMSVCVPACVDMHIFSVWMCMYVSLHVCMHVHLFACLYMHIARVCMSACVHVAPCVCMPACVCICVSACVYIILKRHTWEFPLLHTFCFTESISFSNEVFRLLWHSYRIINTRWYSSKTEIIRLTEWILCGNKAPNYKQDLKPCQAKGELCTLLLVNRILTATRFSFSVAAEPALA